jgi:hypothetical protein
LSLLGRRSRRICSLVAPRTNPKILSAAVSIVFYRAAKHPFGLNQAGQSSGRNLNRLSSFVIKSPPSSNFGETSGRGGRG